ncbi:HAD family hydrolase [bacterium]|nr:HAD family hydrolase [bacterium]
MPFPADIEWLFVDVGGVLLDDRPLLDALYRFFADWFQDHGEDISHQDFLATRNRLEAEGQPQVYKRVLEYHAPSLEAANEALTDFRTWLEPRQFELNPLLPGVKQALDQLQPNFHLALAANQGAYIHDLLARHGIRDYFEQAFIAGELGISKPDARFFQAMLKDTGVAPDRAVMIGDSIPNDIHPALQAGMHAIHVDRTILAPAIKLNSTGFMVAKSFADTPELFVQEPYQRF